MVKVFMLSKETMKQAFHYPRSQDPESLKCHKCKKKIPVGFLIFVERFKDHTNYYHHDCFLEG